jgi:hypothetical protein
VSPYDLIDGILSRWAEAHSLGWHTEYQDTEVRTFYLNPNRRDRVQVAVDAPKGENTTIRIGQNQRGLSRLNRVETITASVFALPSALDKALKTASEWASDIPPIDPKDK